MNGSQFDRVLERRGTGSLKWDAIPQFFGVDDALPLWVADMDFAAPECVTSALASRVSDGVFGYSLPPDGYFDALRLWMLEGHGWDIRRDWILSCTGVVTAVSAAILALTRPGDGVLIQPPVYHPFRDSILGLGRRLVENPLLLEGGRYSMDLPGLEANLRECSLAILCSPHNPVGRVWTREELQAYGSLCADADVPVVSDEIHADIVYRPGRHTPLATAGGCPAESVVTCFSASKSFNLAGLQTAQIICPSGKTRSALALSLGSMGVFGAGALGPVASEAAWKSGHPWLEELMEYLSVNLGTIRRRIACEIPGVSLIEPEGTYLAWLDFRGLGMDDDDLESMILSRAGLALDRGRSFGTGGGGFMRLNYACPASILGEALDRLATALGPGGGNA